jgi:hypothetical protein
VTAPAAIEQAWRPPWRRTRLIVLGLVLATLAVVALAGGLRRAPTPPAGVPSLMAGSTVDSGPWTAAITEASAVSTLSPYQPHPNSWLLAVSIRIQVGGAAGDGAADLDRVASLPGQAGLTEPTPRWVVLRRDRSELVELNPAMPELVMYVFELGSDTRVPGQVTVQLDGYRSHDTSAAGSPEWTNFGPLARVTVPVRDAR